MVHKLGFELVAPELYRYTDKGNYDDIQNTKYINYVYILILIYLLLVHLIIACLIKQTFSKTFYYFHRLALKRGIQQFDMKGQIITSSWGNFIKP